MRGRRDLWGRVRRLVRFSRSIAVVQIAVNMQSRFDAIVIAAFLPVREVTPTASPSGSRTARGSRRTSSGRFCCRWPQRWVPLPATRRGARAVPDLDRLTLAIALGVGLLVALLGGLILEIWVGTSFRLRHARRDPRLCGDSRPALVSGGRRPPEFECHGLDRVMATGSAEANVGLLIALVEPWGVEGVATGTLVASAVEILVFVVPYAARVLGYRRGSSCRTCFRRGAVRLLPSVLLGGNELPSNPVAAAGGRRGRWPCRLRAGVRAGSGRSSASARSTAPRSRRSCAAGADAIMATMTNETPGDDERRFGVRPDRLRGRPEMLRDTIESLLAAPASRPRSWRWTRARRPN